MHEDDDRLHTELERIERELDRELLHHDLHPGPVDRRTAGPGRPSALRLRVERSALAGVSLLALALGVRTLGHRCPEPPPALPAQTAPPDAGALADDGAPEQADGESSSDAEEDDDACPAVEAEGKREWVRAHLQLKALTEAGDSSWSEPIAWALAVPDRLAGFFPAVSRDGRTIVQIYYDTEDFTGKSITTMVFFSVPAGKVVGSYVLHYGRDADMVAGDSASAKELLRSLESDRTAANRLLDATEWRHLASARTPSRPCPGTPWEKLDEERSRRDDWNWHRIARFDAEGIDLEYDPERTTITLRALQEDGTLRTAVVDAKLESPGKWSDGSGCGENGGIDGFGSRELGAFFLFGADDLLGGDSCVGVDTALRTSILHLPRGL